MKAKSIHLLFFVVILYQSLNAQIPGTISFQGVLTDTMGVPKPDEVYLLTFRLYETPAGGSPVWSEQNSISVEKGLFSYSLGSINAFSPSVEFDKPYWLAIEISEESELAPRIPLTSSPYSFSSVRFKFADTSFVAVTTISDTLSQTSGLNIFRLNGNVGLGKIPSSKLDVDGTIKGTTLLKLKNGSTNSLSTAGQSIIGASKGNDNNIITGFSPKLIFGNIITSTEDKDNIQPNDFSLFQNYPNPFNPTTTIEYALPSESNVKIAVFNILGEKAAMLVNSRQFAGIHSINFNAGGLASGIYFYQIEVQSVTGAGNFIDVKKMILLK